jgi:23S rRNA (guanosine2251-2'-O)-methyltransferase
MKNIRNKPKHKSSAKTRGSKNLVFYGRHAVEAAIKNSDREKICLSGTAKSLAELAKLDLPTKNLVIKEIAHDKLESLTGFGVPHQGLALEVRHLSSKHVDDYAPIEGQSNIIIALDQVTDPQNVGAIIRSAAAFGARAIITTDRNSPPESGALAKAASGGLEIIPWVRVPNLARALEELAEQGYWRVGLSGEADTTLAQTDAGKNIVLVMGSEGQGIRQGVERSCDYLAKLPINSSIESLNVSVATSISLYELIRDN